MEVLNPMAKDIVAVRGNCDAEVDQMLLDFPVMADYALIVDEVRKLFLTHGHVYDPDHLPPGNFDAVFYGHTHLWHLDEGTPAVCNTGSITFPKGGNEPTVVTYENGVITVRTLPDETMPEGKVLKPLLCHDCTRLKSPESQSRFRDCTRRKSPEVNHSAVTEEWRLGRDSSDAKRRTMK